MMFGYNHNEVGVMIPPIGPEAMAEIRQMLCQRRPLLLRWIPPSRHKAEALLEAQDKRDRKMASKGH